MALLMFVELYSCPYMVIWKIFGSPQASAVVIINRTWFSSIIGRLNAIRRLSVVENWVDIVIELPHTICCALKSFFQPLYVFFLGVITT